MHDDLIDGVNWIVKQGVADPKKVAIMGGSYGGYAALAGLTFTPTTFACAVDIVGPSNLETLLGTIPPYWEAGKKQMYSRMGDPTTEEGKAILRAASPLYKADQIVRPLLIGQGANDPRVKQSESDQIVAAMQGHGIPVTYVLFPDEGHGFHRPENNIAFSAVVEGFLATVLGGRAEPLGDTIDCLTGKDIALMEQDERGKAVKIVEDALSDRGALGGVLGLAHLARPVAAPTMPLWFAAAAVVVRDDQGEVGRRLALAGGVSLLAWLLAASAGRMIAYW